MRDRAPLVIGCVVLAAVFVLAAVVYFTRTAADVPAFFRGHDAHSTKHHVNHGVALLGLAVLAGIGAWMLAGPSDEPT